MFGPIGIVDYGCGNLHSVLSAFEFLGAEAELITTPEDFEQFESFILPGVGSFKYAMDQLYQRQLAEPLITSVQSQNKKLFGEYPSIPFARSVVIVAIRLTSDNLIAASLSLIIP